MTNPPVTPATRRLYNALAIVRMATVPIAMLDDPGDGNDPYEIERWATAELQTVQTWRMACQRFTMAAQDVDPAAWNRQKTLLRGFVAVWLAEQFPDMNAADECDGMVADVVAAIDALGEELGVREAVAA